MQHTPPSLPLFGSNCQLKLLANQDTARCFNVGSAFSIPAGWGGVGWGGAKATRGLSFHLKIATFLLSCFLHHAPWPQVQVWLSPDTHLWPGHIQSITTPPAFFFLRHWSHAVRIQAISHTEGLRRMVGRSIALIKVVSKHTSHSSWLCWQSGGSPHGQAVNSNSKKKKKLSNYQHFICSWSSKIQVFLTI